MASYKDVDDSFIAAHRAKFNLLLITATEIERSELHAHLKPLPGQTDILSIQNQKHTYFLGVFGVYYAVHVACNDTGSIGRASSLVTTMAAISTWKPSVVLMVGIAFGANEQKQNIGDVLVAERILPYDPERVGEHEAIPRGKEGPASSLLFDRFKSVTGWTFTQEGRVPNIIYGTILTGEKLIDDPTLKAQLMSKYKEAKGGEMEGAGIYAACDQGDVDWILVKGICDFADGNKGKNKPQYQQLAIESAVALCELVFSAPYSFKDVSLTVQDEVLKTDFSEDKGAIPEWMLKMGKSLAKEIRNED